MAVVWYEGFDLYSGSGANTGIQTRWVPFVGGGSGTSTSLVTGRFNGLALRTSRANSNNVYTLYSAALPALYTSITVGLAYRISQLGSQTPFVWLSSSGGVQVALRVTGIGKIEAITGTGSNFSGVTVLGTSATAPVFANTWHFVEFSTAIDAAAGTVTVKVDGDTILTLTGKNTKPQSQNGADTLSVGFSEFTTGFANDFDDIYVLNTTTSIGECRVETLRSNGDTATADWTPNSGVTGYTQVDDTTADGDTTYIQSTSVGDHSLFDQSDLSTTPTAIYAVQPVIFADKTDSATRSLYLTIQSNGVDDDGSAVFLAANYNAFRRILETNPDGSVAWTKTTVDAVKVGPKVAS